MSILRPEGLAEPGGLLAVVFVGGTCAGKSTLAYHVQSELVDRCEVSRRYTTREPRLGDDAEELTSVGWDEFRLMVADNQFVLSWERPMTDGPPIGYGCLAVSRGRTPLLLAGHGIYTNPRSVRPRAALDRALIIGVSAPEEVRATRMSLRSPDVLARDPERARALFVHDETAMLENVDLVVHNHGLDEGRALIDTATAVAALLER